MSVFVAYSLAEGEEQHPVIAWHEVGVFLSLDGALDACDKRAGRVGREVGPWAPHVDSGGRLLHFSAPIQGYRYGVHRRMS